MEKVALWVRLEAKAGKENDLAQFLKSAVPMVEAEPETLAWYALQIGPSTFGIFDTFAGDSGREAHLSGKVAAALMAKAPELLNGAPSIQKVDLLAVKGGK
jgi:quinol monooxygenase YgiN